jgi:hypothetical protein
MPTNTARAYHRVNTPFVGVSGADGNFRAVTLEPGANISVRLGNTVLRSGLVEVVYEGMVLSAFLRDIEDRTERIEAHVK